MNLPESRYEYSFTAPAGAVDYERIVTEACNDCAKSDQPAPTIIRVTTNGSQGAQRTLACWTVARPYILGSKRHIPSWKRMVHHLWVSFEGDCVDALLTCETIVEVF